jgi:hypothetical protein
MGRRQTFVATVLNDCAEWLTTSATLSMPNSATALRLRSSQAGDATVSSGTHTVEVCYISADSGYVGRELCYVASLDGTNYVNLPFAAQAINNMEAITGGLSEVSIGNITLENSGNANLIYSQITAGGNKSLGAFYMVPVSHTAYMGEDCEWDAGAINQSMDARLRATVRTSDRSLIGRYLFQANAFLAAGERHSENLPGLKFPAGSRIKVSAIPGATTGSPRMDASFSLIILADG